MTDKIYTSDFGTKITNNLQTDITGYTTIKYQYKKPDGSTGEFNLTVENLTCGIVYYVTQSGDLDQAGDWIFQTEVVHPTTEFSSNSFIVPVYAPFT
jgi:hypothetical protein